MKMDYNSLHSNIKTFMSEYDNVYRQVKQNQDWKNPFRAIVSETIPSALKQCANIEMPYLVEGSYGKGRWTEVPWIAVFDSRITKSAQKGLYIVYLLNKNTKTLYLSLEIAATEVVKTDTTEKGINHFTGMVGKVGKKDAESFKKRVDEIRKEIPDAYFSSDERIDSGSERYDVGTVYYRKYELDTLPSGEELVVDLRKMMEIYRKYYMWKNTEDSSLTESIEENNLVQIQTRMELIRNSISEMGYKYESDVLKNYYLCLRSKPFVILAGTSGTGKSKLVRLFAEAIGADYCLIPVRPDWSDSSDLLGHTDLQGNYIAGDLLKAIKRATDNPRIIHFVCLDEMNLARVEYYLSDFLSLIETREWKGKEIVTTPLRIDEAAGKEYSGLYIPENLYIVGTVNMDETTFPFSKKVLDRANTIEFSEVDLIPAFSESKGLSDDEPEQISNDFLVSKYLVLEKDIIKSEEQEFATGICKELQKINKILERANAHVGYRVRDEIVFYMLNNREAELLKRDEAFDFEIMQKILPRIQGSTAAVKDLLIDLFKEFGGDFTTGSSDLIWKQMQSYIGSDKPKKYPKSVQKICYMMRKIEEDGFTSYWI